MVRDDLDARPQTPRRCGVSHGGVNNIFWKEKSMSHLINAPNAGRRAKLSMLLLGSLAGVLAVGTAGAADADVPSMSVKYTQQSLATESGVHDLYRRITEAARKVCPETSTRDLGEQQKVTECRHAAVARAIRQIDDPRLAALHAAHPKNG